MSQTKRKAVVAAPATNKSNRYETNASTWGEFKGEISSLLTGNLDAICPELGGAALTRDDAKLPEGDFRVFLIPNKNKAGAVSPQQARELGDAISAAIQEATSKVSVNEAKELKEKLIETIEEFFDVDLSNACPECDEALRDAKKMM